MLQGRSANAMVQERAQVHGVNQRTCNRCTKKSARTRLLRKGTTRVLQEGYKSVTGVLQECYRSVTEVLQKCYRRILPRIVSSCLSGTPSCTRCIDSQGPDDNTIRAHNAPQKHCNIVSAMPSFAHHKVPAESKSTIESLLRRTVPA
jgi:hypothetical protein